MNWAAVVYNVCIGSGLVLITIGVSERWGWPIGLIALGALVIGLTVFTTLVFRSAR